MLRLGIVGTGHMAATMLVAMRQVRGAEGVAVCSHSPERATGFAQQFGLEAGYSDLAHFCEAAQLDGVYIANSNAQHAETARICLEAGLPVFIEKPLGLDAGETRAIHALGQDKGLLVLENLWTLALPAYKALKGALSDRGGARLSFDFSLPATPEALPGLYRQPGGGVLLDRGVYGCAAALDLLGPVAALSARLSRDEGGIETSATLSLDHESGAQSHITVSLDVMGRNTLSVATQTAQMELGAGLAAEYVQMTSYEAQTQRLDPLEGVAGGAKARLKALPLLRRAKHHKSQLGGQFHSYGATPYEPILQEFISCLEGGHSRSDLVPADLSVQVAELIDEARATR